MMIHKRFLFLPVFAVLALAGGGPVRAQDCGILPNAITDLRDPAFAHSTLWSAVYGDKNLVDKLVGGIVDEADGAAVFAGERYWDSGRNVSLILQKFNQRGRVVWDRIYSGLNFSDVQTVLPHDDGMLVMANIVDPKSGIRSVWIGVFDREGQYRKHFKVGDGRGSIRGEDLVWDTKRQSLVLAARTVPDQEGQQAYSVFYTLDKGGKILSKRALNIGMENVVHSVYPLESGGYAGAGYIMADGRKSGWLIRMDQKGSIDWQRPYPRGKEAEFVKILPYRNGYGAVLGMARPYDVQTPDSRNMGSWVLMVNMNGSDILWERFYTEDEFHLYAGGLAVHDDGQVSALMNASRREAAEEGIDIENTNGFVRLVTHNSRGVVLDSASYFNGKGAAAHALATGLKGERVMGGVSEVPFEMAIHDPKAAAGDAPAFQNIMAQEAWAIAAPPVNPYEDPCIKPAER